MLWVSGFAWMTNDANLLFGSEHQTGGADDSVPPSPLVERKLEPLLKLVPEKERDAARLEIRRVIAQEFFCGPLPHPEHFEHYEAAVPGSASRIIGMAEREQRHRHWGDKLILISEAGLAMVGMGIGGAVGFGLMYFALEAAKIGQPTVSYAYLAASAVGMIGTFVKGRSIFRKAPREEGPEAPGGAPPKAKAVKKKATGM
ncbi:MAG: DUF2335 domain-containing protein [Rhodospirillales bacterium]|nr:DUF2335 domain-containing protein [Rhodospirillales bacterium]